MIQIFTDTSANLPAAYIQKYSLRVIPLTYFVDGAEAHQDPAVDFDGKAYYDAMRSGTPVSTAMINLAAFLEPLHAALAAGDDVIYIGMSGGISGTAHAAAMAVQELQEEFPERKIIVVDSLCGSGGAAILMLEAARQRDAGRTMEETAAWIEARRLHVHHWLFTPELAYFVRGGRVSAAAGWIGTLLRLCPVIEANCEGKLIPREKIRGKQRALRVLVEKMVSYAEGGMAYDGPCHISHADNLADAEQLAGMIEEKFPQLRGKIVINTVGTTLGSHCGPGMVALFFYGTERGR